MGGGAATLNVVAESYRPGKYGFYDSRTEVVNSIRESWIERIPAARISRPPILARHDPRGQGTETEVVEQSTITAVGTASERPPPKPKTTLEKIVPLVEELHRCGPGEDELLHQRLLQFPPSIVLSTMLDFFPGALWFHRHSPHIQLARGRSVCAVGRLMVALGVHAAPYVALLLEAKHPDVRFYGALIAIDLNDAGVNRRLAQLLYDRDPGVRAAVVSGLTKLPSHVGEEWLLQLRQEVMSSGKRAELAIEALSAARDEKAVEPMIVALGNERIADLAQQALILLTGGNQGESQDAWRTWWRRHRRECREEWLMHGFVDRQPVICALACSELERIAGESFALDPAGDFDARRRAQTRAREWFKRRNRRRAWNADDDV